MLLFPEALNGGLKAWAIYSGKTTFCVGIKDLSRKKAHLSHKALLTAKFLNQSVPNFFSKMTHKVGPYLQSFKPQEISQFLWCYSATGNFFHNRGIFDNSFRQRIL